VRVEVVTYNDGSLRLSVVTAAPGPSWLRWQQIKDKVAGPEREGVQVYPARSRLVDHKDAYHLWVFPAGKAVPLGWTPDGKGGAGMVGRRWAVA
jgi:hypothetical protein